MLVTEGRSQVTRIATDPVTMAYHELRSPLALVATVARSAAEECEDELVRARCLSIVRAAERMIRTAGHLMDLAETSQAEKVEQFNPLPCIDQNTTVLGVRVGRAGADLLRKCEEVLVPGGTLRGSGAGLD